MEQYWSIKSQHRDKILLFRMGDFFEMFGEDAETAAPLLNIALTVRNKKSGDNTKMCGVPHHSIATPVSKLLSAGLNVAICDQLEPSETTNSGGLVKRAVTRILSPGMVYDPETLDQLNANYMSAVEENFISFLDISTGTGFYYEVSGPKEILKLLKTLQPSELLLTPEQKEKRFPQEDLKPFHITVFNEEYLLKRADLIPARQKIGEKYGNSPACVRRLAGYALFMQGESALGMLDSFERVNGQKEIYCSSRLYEHLEVFKNSEGSPSDSLFKAVNRTKTPGGARVLKKRLKFPLRDRREILERHNQIDWWMARPELLESTRKTLSSLGDGERKMGKLTHTHCHGRDLLAVAEVLSSGLQLQKTMKDPLYIKERETAEKIKNHIFRTIQPTAPAGLKDGGTIQKGVQADLDACVDMARDAQSRLRGLEQSERRKTGIPSLKIRYNNVFGYYIEVTKAHGHKVPPSYRRKQTLVHAERYDTEELESLAGKVLSAKSRQIHIERDIFQSLLKRILDRLPDLLKLCRHWNEIDVSSSLAFSATENRYVRPEFGNKLLLVNSRHPVLEQKPQQVFVPNTIEIKPGDTLILTGPNMAGKSTLMRQTALSVLLAQSGCFVPADRAVLPVFHKIFTRIGAGDFLSKGLSTFMVEMKEMAEILDQADSKSLIILDEIGRGTATFDGMSLAQSILEFLTCEKKPVLLSATHYHELTAMAERHPSIHNGSMSIKEKDEKIHFLYTLSKGPANKSYGIQVARLAGLPQAVIEKAEKLLKKHERNKKENFDSAQLNLFSAENSYIRKSFGNQSDSLITDSLKPSSSPQAGKPSVSPSLRENTFPKPPFSKVLNKISEYHLNENTPLDAMNQIADWQKEIKKESEKNKI